MYQNLRLGHFLCFLLIVIVPVKTWPKQLAWYLLISATSELLCPFVAPVAILQDSRAPFNDETMQSHHVICMPMTPVTNETIVAVACECSLVFWQYSIVLPSTQGENMTRLLQFQKALTSVSKDAGFCINAHQYICQYAI